MKKYTMEFKVGIFFLICLAGFFYLIYSTGKLNIKKKGYYIYAVFNEVAGLGKKAPVMLNGLEVGKVEELKVSYDADKTSVILKIWLDSEAKVRENPVVSIKTLGLMGEKYIQISSTEGKNFVQPEAILQGKPYKDMDSLMDQTDTITKSIDSLVVQLDKLASDLHLTLKDNKDEISQIVDNLGAASKNFADFSGDVKRNPWKLLIKQKEVPAKPK